MTPQSSLISQPSPLGETLFTEIKERIDAFCTDERKLFMFLERFVVLRRRIINQHNILPQTRSVSNTILSRLSKNDSNSTVTHTSPTVKNPSPPKHAASDDSEPTSFKRRKRKDEKQTNHLSPKAPLKKFRMSQIVRITPKKTEASSDTSDMEEINN